MQWSGFTRLLELRRTKPGLLILNHHRIGDAASSRFDRAVFGATADELDQQVRYVKRRFPIVCGEELEEIVRAEKPLRRLHVAITFDDGYRDNYSVAFPVLQSNGCAAMFFLVADYVGTNTIPWWDEIAYLVRNSPRTAISLHHPEPLTVDLEGDRERAIFRVLQHYKRADNTSPTDFLADLRSAAECDLPDVGRRFLNWDEAGAMQRAGMRMGSHTMTHRILSQLSPEEQEQELSHSRFILEEKLGCAVTSLAYPVGASSTFNSMTERLAQAAGYRACFSFTGGVNTPKTLCATAVLRTSIAPDHFMFRSQMTLLSHFGKLPYA